MGVRGEVFHLDDTGRATVAVNGDQPRCRTLFERALVGLVRGAPDEIDHDRPELDNITDIVTNIGAYIALK